MPQSQELYFSRALYVKFNLKRKSYKNIAESFYVQGQFYSWVSQDNKLRSVHGYRGCILVVDAETLNEGGQIFGYKFLHCTALHCTALHCTALHCTESASSMA
jgi:hypothetical protein